MQFQFEGTGIDLNGARGPRGGTFTVSLDGGTPTRIDEYRAPADPSKPDLSGRKDLDFVLLKHFDVPAGSHTLRINVTNDQRGVDPKRDMVYVDNFVVTGDGAAPSQPGSLTDLTTQVTGTVAAGATTVLTVVMPAAATAFAAVLEGSDQLKETIQDGANTVLATADSLATVAVATIAPVAPGVYAISITNTGVTTVAFTMWEVITEAR
jgi:hypothetical protein